MAGGHLADNKLKVLDNTTPTSAREDYFQKMRESLMAPFETGHTYTPEEKLKIDKHLRGLSTGSSAMVPLHCAGPACPFALRCPYQQINKAPIGKPCIIEVQLIQYWVVKYMEEYEVDPASFTEVGYCNELAEIEVMLSRINQQLGKPENADGTVDQMVGVAHDGTPITQKQISPYMDMRDKLQNRRSKIIKLMVGDRQEKYKKEAALKVRESKDPSSRQAETRRKLEALQRGIQRIEVEQQAKALPEPADGEFQLPLEKKELENVFLSPDSLIANEE